MTLRRKTLVIVGATLVGLIVIVFAISEGIFLNSFSRLEVKDTSKNVERALGALSDETSSLVTMTRDWAVWDDTYNFIENGNNEYIEANPTDAEFEALRVNVMLFINSSGQIVYSEAFDLEQEQEVPVPQSLLGHISPESIILQHSNTESGVSGIILLPEGPLLIAAQPILTSQGDGPIRGTLIWGRHLDSAEIGRLAETTHLSLTVQRLDEPQMSSDFEAARSSLSEKTPIFVRPLDKEFVAGYSLLEDVYGKPVMMLRIDLPREIYHQGQTSQLYFIASILGVGLVFGVVVLSLLGKSVLAPLSRLSAAVSSIGRTGVLSTRVSAKGKDELSSLAGEINRMLGSLERSYDELRESEEKFKRLVEDMNDGYFVVQNYRIVFANARSAEIFGYSVENVIGKTVEQFLSPAVAESLSEWHTRLLRGEIVPRQYETALIRNDGTSVTIEFGARRMYYEGKPAVSVVVRDVTERKEADEKLKQIMAELARSNTELEQFAYVASHDLQEPLRMVASYTQLLARRYRGKLDADADEFIGYAVDGATRMQQLINGLLDYSRVGTRGKPFEPTDCEAVFNNAVANLGAAIKEADAVVIHDHLPTVLADSTQMVQLFQNLLGNSIKFPSDKPPEIHVRAQRNGSEWIFSVRDNGIGIDPKYFERIFIIFQRLHGRGEYPGTGIGLAICKKIVERHKGRIWVESELGKGATFHFTIPMGGEGKR